MKKNIFPVITLLFLIGLQIQIVLLYERPENVVVNVQDVFNGFEMKKELQSKIKNIELKQKIVLDSINLELKNLEKEFELAKTETNKQFLRDQYAQMTSSGNQRRQSMQEQLALAVENYDEQIWNQLNGYIKEYGRVTNKNLVLGNIQKNVLFNSNHIDKTEELLLFVNAKYQGTK